MIKFIPDFGKDSPWYVLAHGIVTGFLLMTLFMLAKPLVSHAQEINPELVEDGGFETPGDWVLGYSWQILPAPGAVAFHNEGYTAPIEKPVPALVAGHTYRVSYKISGSAGSTDPRHWFRMRGTSGYASCPIYSGDGTFGCDIVAPAGVMSILIRPVYGFSGVLDDVSVREVPP